VFRSVVGLATHGRQVVLCTERPGYADAPLTDEQRAQLAARGVFVYSIPLAPLRKAFAPRHWLAGVCGAHGRPRAIVAHLGKNGYRALSLGAVADVPILAIFHGEDANLEVRDSRYRARFARWFVSPGAMALGVAAHLTRKVVEAGFSAERAHTHHLGLDLEEYAPRPPHAGDGPLRLVLSGRLMAVKGHATALEALVRIREALPGTTLHCYGEGGLEAPLRERARGLGLDDALKLHGAVPVARLREELSRSDLLLQPSEVDPEGRCEGVPNSILEAMAVGLPVVATQHGGIPEAVVDGETGVLVPEHEPAALARAVIGLADPARRQRLGAAGRARVEVHFAQEGQASELAERIAEARVAHAAMPPAARRQAWLAALDGYVELPEAIGRRERLRWPARLLVNAWRQEIG